MCKPIKSRLCPSTSRPITSTTTLPPNNSRLRPPSTFTTRPLPSLLLFIPYTTMPLRLRIQLVSPSILCHLQLPARPRFPSSMHMRSSSNTSSSTRRSPALLLQMAPLTRARSSQPATGQRTSSILQRRPSSSEHLISFFPFLRWCLRLLFSWPSPASFIPFDPAPRGSLLLGAPKGRVRFFPPLLFLTPSYFVRSPQHADRSRSIRKHALTLQLHTAHILSAHASLEQKSKTIQDIREQKNKCASAISADTS